MEADLSIAERESLGLGHGEAYSRHSEVPLNVDPVCQGGLQAHH